MDISVTCMILKIPAKDIKSYQKEKGKREGA